MVDAGGRRMDGRTLEDGVTISTLCEPSFKVTKLHRLAYILQHQQDRET